MKNKLYDKVLEKDMMNYLKSLQSLGIITIKDVGSEYQGKIKSKIVSLQFQLEYNWFNFNKINYVFLSDLKTITICEDKPTFTEDMKISLQKIKRQIKMKMILQ